jgi:heavy metal translocating P-type ATPase
VNHLQACACAYCGLPVAGRWRDDAEPAYCCYGCRFAAAVTEARAEGGSESRWMFARLGLAIFFTMNVMVFAMALWSGELYEADDAPLAGLFRYLSMFFALPVLCWLGGPLAENAWDAGRRGRFSTDLLLVLGVAAAYGYSTISVLRDTGPIYFEVGCMVLLLVTIGRWLEATGRARATHALDALAKLLPERVRLLDDRSEKPLGDVAIGDRLHVRAGERVPCDGIVLRQPAWLDEQLLTGESGPRAKEPGDTVYAGTLNLDGDLFMEVQRRPEAGAVARIVRMIRQAQERKGRCEQVADRLTAWFLPLVGLLAIAAGVHHGLEDGIDHGLMTGLAVVLIACPCALGIATPLAVWVATGTAARHQVLFQSGATLERLAAVRHLCFDKTGTLTQTAGCRVSRWIAADDGDGALDRARALAAASNHGLSRAIVAEDGATPQAAQCTGVRTLPGRGLSGTWPLTGEMVWLGSERLMTEQQLAMPVALAEPTHAARAAGQPLVLVGWSGSVRGLFVVSEEVRPEAPAALTELRALGVGVTVLSGDHEGRATVVAHELGVAVRGDLLPEAKAAFLARLRGPVGMVGDGINDGPALAAADIGIAMGCGADVARDTAGVCLLNDDLTRLPWAIRLARRTVHVMRQNLFWALVYNVVGIGLAATGRLNPVFAAAAMALSSLLVVANSLRLRASEPRPSGSGEVCTRSVTVAPRMQHGVSVPCSKPS